MKEDKLDIDETTLSVDLSDATDAVKESRFEDALNLLKIILKDHPDHISIDRIRKSINLLIFHHKAIYLLLL